MSDNCNEKNNCAPRKRSLTSLTLSWIAERMRRQEKVKEALNSGQYSVSSEELAKSIVMKVRQ